jgi:hypothetical protein
MTAVPLLLTAVVETAVVEIVAEEWTNVAFHL